MLQLNKAFMLWCILMAPAMAQSAMDSGTISKKVNEVDVASPKAITAVFFDSIPSYEKVVVIGTIKNTLGRTLSGVAVQVSMGSTTAYSSSVAVKTDVNGRYAALFPNSSIFQVFLKVEGGKEGYAARSFTMNKIITAGDDINDTITIPEIRLDRIPISCFDGVKTKRQVKDSAGTKVVRWAPVRVSFGPETNAAPGDSLGY